MKKFYTYLKATLLFAIALVSLNAQAQSNGSISGTITTSDGKIAEAVNVFVKELNRGFITSEKGTFDIKNVKPGTYTVKSGGVGLAYQEQKVTVTAGQASVLNFKLTESSEKLAEVVVTGYKSVNQRPVSAGKVAIKPLDNPQMVQVIGSQVIADQQANRLSDVMKNVNGVALGTTRGQASETFYSRGYSLGNSNIFKNGSRVSSGAIPEASTLESIEVLKGSAALLYGNVAAGAVINMVTKQPKYNFGGEVSLRSGSYDFYKPTVDVYGPITDKLAFRVIGTGEDTKSFRQSVESDRIYVNPSLLYKFNKKTNISLQADYLKYNNTPDFGIGSMEVKEGSTIVKYVIPSINRSSFFNTNWAYNKANQKAISANLNHELNSNWKLNGIASYQNYERQNFGAERIQIASTGDYARNLAKGNSNEFYSNAQVNLTGDVKTGSITHTILVGTDAEQFRTKSDVFTFTKQVSGKSVTFYLDENNQDVELKAYDVINVLDPSKSAPRTDMLVMNAVTQNNTPVYRFGYYAQDLIGITPYLKVLAGLRWTYQKTAVVKTYDYRIDQTKSGASSKYDRAFSPKLGIVVQPVKTTSVFASYSNNFATNTGTDVDMNVLRPSIIDQYELGVKNDFLNGRLSANISVYRIKNDASYVQAMYTADGVTANANSAIKELAGEITSDGLELDLNGTVAKGLNFIAGYSYNFIRYTESTGKKYSYVEGERLVNSTANTANGSLFYTLNSGRIRGVKLGASAFFTGKRNGGWNNQNGGIYTYDRLVPLSAYTTFDLSAGYSLRGFSLLAKLSNITNELNYVVHENYSVNPIAPRQVITTLTYKF